MTHPDQPDPGQTTPGQPHPGPTYQGQTDPGRHYPGRPHPGQVYPGQTDPGRSYPAQPYSGQVYPGQPNPGGQYSAHIHPGQPYPGQPYPGQMRAVDQHTAVRVRPTAVTASFTLWILTALSWPVGSIARSLAEDGAIAGFGPIMALFTSTCLAIACVWGAVLLLGGSYHARLGLCGGALVVGVLALAAAIIASRDGDAGALTWVVIVARLVLPAAAAAAAFLPGTRQYFSGT
ncbi:hypothetical protein LZG04_13840 [Saccharothrix sp. S26]|uniref:hypothetical protein n=1 Tax=Saccharothrix sp. S26 TaxID=2907215 RepID=UPI001F36063E|nr:hypothetical protein [Saccharothrix sp. S26]MCE6995874.1 hypothetical protein [Saccharothrix sp. S26]